MSLSWINPFSWIGSSGAQENLQSAIIESNVINSTQQVKKELTWDDLLGCSWIVSSPFFLPTTSKCALLIGLFDRLSALRSDLKIDSKSLIHDCAKRVGSPESSVWMSIQFDDKYVISVGNKDWKRLWKWIIEGLEQSKTDRDLIVIIVSTVFEEAICYSANVWMIKAFSVRSVLDSCCMEDLRKVSSSLTIGVIGEWLSEDEIDFAPKYVLTMCNEECLPGKRTWDTYYRHACDFQEFAIECAKADIPHEVVWVKHNEEEGILLPPEKSTSTLVTEKWGRARLGRTLENIEKPQDEWEEDPIFKEGEEKKCDPKESPNFENPISHNDDDEEEELIFRSYEEVRSGSENESTCSDDSNIILEPDFDSDFQNPFSDEY